jgi:uncharacterized sulfatase
MALSRRDLLKSAAGGPALLIGATQPNVVFFLTDDQAMWSLRTYGSRYAHAPNTEKIAGEGVVFENSIVTTPVCSPSRASNLTSRYAFEVGINDYINPKQEELGLPSRFPTWPQQLQRAGYRTGLFGKWHLGTRPEFHPTRHGYDRFIGFTGGGVAPKDAAIEMDGATKKVPGFVSEILTDAAIRFIRENRSRRFLVSLHYREPHLPYSPVPEQDAGFFRQPLRDLSVYPEVDRSWLDENLRDYYRAIASVDRCIGRVLSELASLSLDRNTLLIFAGDNGYMIGQHGLNTKGNAVWVSGPRAGRHRPNMFEPSLLVPLLMRYPGVIRAGHRVSAMVTNLDYFPTILDACHVPVPSGYEPRGASLLPLAAGKELPWRTEVYGDYHLINELEHFHEADDTMRMVRTREWKLVTHTDPHYRDELYNLAADPTEERNLLHDPAASKPLETLGAKLAGWQRRLDDPERHRRRPTKQPPYMNP